MSSISVAGDVSGAISIAAPSAAGSGVLTLPTGTDTLIGKATTDTLTNKTLTAPTITGATITVAATAAPAFSAYANSATTLTNSASTKIVFGTVVFDTNSNYSSSRFTPTVAGYYQINAVVSYASGGAASNWISIYKNGSELYRGQRLLTASSANMGITANTIVQFNGTTDYVEVYVFTNGGSVSTATTFDSSFSGAMVRSA
jgi:hypothetical protein